jgi:hypothetical protein
MHISLIGTYHAERGAVTVAALLEVLERIQPEVVFAEIPQSYIDSWMDGSHGTLESLAVSRYAATHAIEVVAVDLPEPDGFFFRDWEEVSRAIELRSHWYRRLMDFNTDRTHKEGLAYLNSEECVRAWSEINREQVETIECIGDSRLRDIYNQFRFVNERRECQMLASIYAYCATAKQGRGAFLVGAAHRGALIDKFRAAGATPHPYIEWDVGVS